MKIAKARAILFRLGVALWVVDIPLLAYLFLYPYFKPSTCQWPNYAPSAVGDAEKSDENIYNGEIKLLAFGDPQIRGSQPDDPWRTKLDILGNDYYLGHISGTLNRILNPTHIAVLGDLLSSQWIENDEFARRTQRYKTRIFPPRDNGAVMINVTGNHDIGYSGEMSQERVQRYEESYGPLNYVLDINPGLRMVVLNDLALDGPFFDDSFHKSTIEFLKQLGQRPFSGSTILLTHIPLEKPEGVCIDKPSFTFWEPEYGGGLKSQNFLTHDSSQMVLNEVFKTGKGIILNGHDHEGCYSTHRLLEGKWIASGPNNEGQIREFTVRSMMGEFGGNGALVSAHWNQTIQDYEFDIRLCRFMLQHYWWIAYVVVAIGFGLIVLSELLRVFERPRRLEIKESKKEI